MKHMDADQENFTSSHSFRPHLSFACKRDGELAETGENLSNIYFAEDRKIFPFYFLAK